MHSSYVSKCITSDLVAWKRRKTSAKKKIGVKEKEKEEKTNFHGIVNIFWESYYKSHFINCIQNKLSHRNYRHLKWYKNICSHRNYGEIEG